MRTRLYWAALSPLRQAEAFARGMERVSEQRRRAVERLRSPEARVQKLGAALLLGCALAAEGLPPAGDFVFGPYGKPALRESTAPRFSLSHSGDRALCALSDAEIGCDLEKLRRPALPIVERRFHPREAAWLFSLPEREQARAFFRLWTLKESYLKATGRGLSLPLSAFCVLPEGEGAVLTAPGDPVAWQLKSFEADEWLCAVCCAGGLDGLEPQRLDVLPEGGGSL